MRTNFVMVACLLLAVPCLLPASTAILTADAYVTSATPKTNYGPAPVLVVKSGSRALLMFDLSTLPAGTTAATVAKATLRLWVQGPGQGYAGPAGTFDVRLVTGAWNEATVTNKTAPGVAVWRAG